MNRLFQVIRTAVTDSDEHAPSRSSRPKGGKLRPGRKAKNSNQRHETQFYDPHAPDLMGSSSDDLRSEDLDRRHMETLTRIEDAEAALAKERKRIEQLELRRKEVEAREEQRRIGQDDDAGLSPREKNRKGYERAVARVERIALRKIEELERRFAYSDKVFELSMARQEMREAEGMECGAVGEEEGQQRHSRTYADDG